MEAHLPARTTLVSATSFHWNYCCSQSPVRSFNLLPASPTNSSPSRLLKPSTFFYSTVFGPSLSSDRFGPMRSLASLHLADTSAAVLLSIKHFPFQALNLCRPLIQSLHSRIDADASLAAHLKGWQRVLYLVYTRFNRNILNLNESNIRLGRLTDRYLIAFTGNYGTMWKKDHISLLPDKSDHIPNKKYFKTKCFKEISCKKKIPLHILQLG